MSSLNFQQRSVSVGVGVGGGRRQPFGFLDDNTLVVSSSASSASKSTSKRNSFAGGASASTATINTPSADHPSDSILKKKKKKEPSTKNTNVRHVLSSIVTRSQARNNSSMERGKSTSASTSRSSSSSSAFRSAWRKDAEVEYPTKRTVRFLLANDGGDDGKRGSGADRIVATQSSTPAVATAATVLPTTKQAAVFPNLPNDDEFVSFDDSASVFRPSVVAATAAPNNDANDDDFWASGMEDMLTLKRANPISSKDGDNDDESNSTDDEGWQEIVDIFKSLADDLLVDENRSEGEGRGEPIYFSSRLTEDDRDGFKLHYHNI
ncbi:hypothetical protein ACHAWU_005735 [Discostella pseudostelligera]|uniref:Uncharacterized protein n=1 Tax=Discostella pseudostelligera TaxID=259834 RepID=A0ABD3MTR1_9STRA